MASLAMTAGPSRAADSTGPTNFTADGVWLRVLLAWIVLSAALITIFWHSIGVLRFGDPDDALRLLEVRDLLAGQSWFDVHQYRVAAPQGVPMHWSRLVDIPLAGMMLLLRPLLGAATAELVTIVAVPLLTLLCAMALVGRLAARCFDRETAGIACLVTSVAGPALFQVTPMRIDHHGWQIVLALAALNGLQARSAWRGGAVLGLSLAALLSISIEGLPLTALFLGVCALRGLRAADGRFEWLTAATTSLALGAAAMFLGTRGTYDLATHCDAVSPIHLGLLAWAAAGTWLLRLAAPRPLALRLGGLALIGAVGAAVMLGGAPECRGGAFVALDPLVRRYWYAGVGEGLPFWNSPMTVAATALMVPFIGLFAIYTHWRRAPDAETRRWWIDYALLLAGAWLIGLLVARATATACVIASVPTAALILRWIVGLRTAPPAARALGYLGVAIALMPALPVVAWAKLVPASEERLGLALTMSKCRYDRLAPALDRLPATDIFAPLDIGPDLLVRTHHRVVATGHHRGSAGMHDVIAAFMSSPDKARAIMAARHTTLLVMCPDISEPAIYSRFAPQGLAARLLRGETPAWLQPLNIAPESHVRVWRIVPEPPRAD